MSLVLFTTAALAPGCAKDPSGEDSLGTATDVSTSGPTSTTDTPTTENPDTSSTTPDPDTSSGSTACDGEIIDAPAAPEGWQGPFLMYGFAGNQGTPPDCGDGTTAGSVGQFSVDTTLCTCECSAPAEDLCAISMFSSCEGGPLGFYEGGCTAFDMPVPAFQASATPLGACASVPAAGVPPLAPSVWSCEIPENGCSSAPPNEGVCIFAEGAAGVCPDGFENGPVASNRVQCDGACPNCTTPDFCSMGLQLELHDTDDCSTPPAQVVGPVECPTGPYAAVRAAPVTLTCMPDVELTRTPITISICCAP